MRLFADISIALSQTRSLVPLKASSFRSQALCLFVELVNFIVQLGHLRSPDIGATQLFKRLADGELGRFSHPDILRFVLCYCIDIVIPLKLKKPQDRSVIPAPLEQRRWRSAALLLFRHLRPQMPINIKP
jgi:hypothetical protein